MNVFLKKEIRLLLPTFAASVVLAFSTLLLKDDGNYYDSGFKAATIILPFILSPALMLMMSLNSFGSEISAGTFSNLLAQPVSRNKIWWTKTGLLATATFSVWTVWWLSFVLNRYVSPQPKELHAALVATTLFPSAIFSGGLWTVLLLRQVAASFWFTLIIPAALTLPIVSFAEKYPNAIEPTLIVVLSAYSIAGFLFAHWLFLRAQDVQWTGGNIALPEMRAWAKWKRTAGVVKTGRPRAALFVKEFQLHQSQLVMAGLLALLHLVVIGIRNLGHGFKESPAIEFILYQFWVLWFVMPLLVGCAAVAEERKLGTLESQLCFPVRRRTQFLIKFFSALLLSVVLCLAMPLLSEGTRILPDIGDNNLKSWSEFSAFFTNPGVRLGVRLIAFVGWILPLLLPAGIAALTLIAAFYASTLSRNTLQSLAPAVLGIVAAVVLLGGAWDVERIFHHVFWRGPLIYFFGVPIMALALAGLMYWNFKHVVLGWNVWRRNILVFLTSIAIISFLTMTIYHRAWEIFTPIEPAHGSALIEKSPLHKIQSYGSRVTIKLADGKVWSSWLAPTPELSSFLSGNWKMSEAASRGAFWEGTNWASVANWYLAEVGIQKDGTLWVSELPREPGEVSKLATAQMQAPKLVKFGDESDWKMVAGWDYCPFLLKTDGTLWRWGTNRVARKQNWPGLRAFQPQRLGADSDWNEIFLEEDRTVFRKKDGRTWVSHSLVTKETNTIRLDDEMSVFRAEQLDEIKSISWVWPGGGQHGGFKIGTSTDGKILSIWDTAKRKFPIGNETNWLAEAGAGEVIVALKTDGTLWKWNFPDNPIEKPEFASAARLGTNSDWVAIASVFGGVFSLAADGSVWFWQFDSRYFRSSDFVPLLAPSRKPQKLASIFDAPNAP